MRHETQNMKLFLRILLVDVNTRTSVGKYYLSMFLVLKCTCAAVYRNMTRHVYFAYHVYSAHLSILGYLKNTIILHPLNISSCGLQGGHFSGIYRKVQLKPSNWVCVPKSSGEGEEELPIEALMILKYGGVLTHAGRKQVGITSHVQVSVICLSHCLMNIMGTLLTFLGVKDVMLVKLHALDNATKSPN